MDIYYIDGQFIDKDRATLAANDITILRGFGAFDFLITYNKRPFFLEAHVARLENSAKKIGLTLLHTKAELCDIVQQTIEQNSQHDEFNVRIVYTGGISPDDVTPAGNGKLMVMVTPKYALPKWWYTEGATVITVDIERFIPEAKSTNYLSAIYAQQQAYNSGAIEAIYVDRNNRVLEGTTTNFFAFKGDTIITPPDTILPGITRSVVLNLIKGKFPLKMRHIDVGELQEMDEVFITASNKEIIPIIKINDMIVSDGKPGKRSRLVMDLFHKYTSAYGQGQVS